jgi:integrase
VDYESHAVALDRNELGALLVAAGLGLSAEHALISLLALNGLRVFEATGADIERLGLERGHRTLTITRKGGKVVTIPLAPRTARAIDLAVGERTDGPVFLAAEGRRLDRHGAGRIVRRTARRVDHDAVRPRSRQPRSARYLYSRRLRGRSCPVTGSVGTALSGGRAPPDRAPAADIDWRSSVTHSDPRTNANRRSARPRLLSGLSLGQAQMRIMAP